MLSPAINDSSDTKIQLHRQQLLPRLLLNQLPRASQVLSRLLMLPGLQRLQLPPEQPALPHLLCVNDHHIFNTRGCDCGFLLPSSPLLEDLAAHPAPRSPQNMTSQPATSPQSAESPSRYDSDQYTHYRGSTAYAPSVVSTLPSGAAMMSSTSYSESRSHAPSFPVPSLPTSVVQTKSELRRARQMDLERQTQEIY